MYKQINVVDFKELFLNNKKKLELIDVREKSEYDQIRIKGSKLIPIREIQNHLNDIDWSKNVIFVCRTGSRSEYITKVLDSHGYSGTNLSGGINILRFNCEECMSQGNIDKDYFE